MAGDSQRPESAEITTILQSYQTEGNDDKQNRFFVDMPTEEK